MFHHNFIPDSVPTTVGIYLDSSCIEDLPALVDAWTGKIVSVQLGGLSLSRAMYRQAVGVEEYARIVRHLQAELPDLIEAAQQDDYDALCDERYDLWREGEA